MSEVDTVPLGTLLYLHAQEVYELCQQFDVLEIVTEAFLALGEGRAGITAEAALRWTASDGTAARSLILPAWYHRNFGCKVISACVGNLARGVSRAHALIILLDSETGVPVCIMEGARVSALRTAAVSIAAIRAIRDLTELRCLGILGGGRQARTHLELLAGRTRLQTVMVYDKDPARGADFASFAWRLLGNVRVNVANRAEDAVIGSDLVIAATTTTSPYVPLAWLSDGAVFINVSLDDATEDLLLGCEHLIVDDWNLVADDTLRLLGRLARSGRVAGPRQTSPPDARRVDTDIATLLAGNYRRPISAVDRIVINPFGMGVHDIALAAMVHASALVTGAGIHLPR